MKDIDFVMKRAAELHSVQPKRSWFSKVPKEAQRRLGEIKQAFRDGKFSEMPNSVVILAIENLLKEQKWPVPGHRDTIIRWLRSTST